MLNYKIDSIKHCAEVGSYHSHFKAFIDKRTIGNDEYNDFMYKRCIYLVLKPLEWSC